MIVALEILVIVASIAYPFTLKSTENPKRRYGARNHERKN